MDGIEQGKKKQMSGVCLNSYLMWEARADALQIWLRFLLRLWRERALEDRPAEEVEKIVEVKVELTAEQKRAAVISYCVTGGIHN